MMENRVIVKKPTSKKIKQVSFKTCIFIFLAVVLVLTYLPILVIALTSFSTDPLGYRMNQMTFNWYGQLVNNKSLRDSIIFTLEITCLSTIIATAFGTMSAIGINSLNKKARKKNNCIK